MSHLNVLSAFSHFLSFSSQRLKFSCHRFSFSSQRNWSPTGEEKAFSLFPNQVLFKKLGIGFVTWHPKKPYEEHLKVAKKAIEEAKNVICSNEYDLVILDEINNAVRFNLLKVEEVLELINAKPKRVNLVLTGRGAHEKIIEIADLVTEMKSIKHPFERGEWARPGIDY